MNLTLKIIAALLVPCLVETEAGRPFVAAPPAFGREALAPPRFPYLMGRWPEGSRESALVQAEKILTHVYRHLHRAGVPRSHHVREVAFAIEQGWNSEQLSQLAVYLVASAEDPHYDALRNWFIQLHTDPTRGHIRILKLAAAVAYQNDDLASQPGYSHWQHADIDRFISHLKDDVWTPDLQSFLANQRLLFWMTWAAGWRFPLYALAVYRIIRFMARQGLHPMRSSVISRFKDRTIATVAIEADSIRLDDLNTSRWNAIEAINRVYAYGLRFSDASHVIESVLQAAGYSPIADTVLLAEVAKTIARDLLLPFGHAFAEQLTTPQRHQLESVLGRLVSLSAKNFDRRREKILSSSILSAHDVDRLNYILYEPGQVPLLLKALGHRPEGGFLILPGRAA